MLGHVREFFRGETSLAVDKTGKPTAKDSQIASAVLLLQMAGSDNDYAPEEVKSIFRSLQDAFGIADKDTLDFLEEVDALRHEKDRIDEFVATVNKSFDSKQKQLLYSMVWKVVLADGKITKDETRYAKQLQNRLQLTDEMAREAQNWVESGQV